MGLSAAKADGAISLTAVVARRNDGRLVLLVPSPGRKVVEVELDDSSDHALDLYARLKTSKGEGGKYTAAACFLRSKTTRRRQFV